MRRAQLLLSLALVQAQYHQHHMPRAKFDDQTGAPLNDAARSILAAPRRDRARARCRRGGSVRLARRRRRGRGHLEVRNARMRTRRTTETHRAGAAGFEVSRRKLRRDRRAAQSAGHPRESGRRRTHQTRRRRQDDLVHTATLMLNVRPQSRLQRGHRRDDPRCTPRATAFTGPTRAADGVF